MLTWNQKGVPSHPILGWQFLSACSICDMGCVNFLDFRCVYKLVGQAKLTLTDVSVLVCGSVAVLSNVRYDAR